MSETIIQVFAVIETDDEGRHHLRLSDEVDLDFIVDGAELPDDAVVFETVTVELRHGPYEVEELYTVRLAP